MKIDIFTHIFPEKYLATLKKKTRLDKYREVHNRTCCDTNLRLRLMDRQPDVLHVLTMSLPPVETLVPPDDAIELARIANNELAELVGNYPDKFYAAVACLPLNYIDAALEGTDCAITELKLRGIQLFTNINGEPLDSPKFRPLYEKMASYDLPIWIHPWIRRDQPQEEPVARFDYELAVAMLKLVSAGVFLDYPDIKFIIHHCGGVIPILEGRARWFQPPIARKGAVINPVEHLRRFYGDTAVSGSTAALMCGYSFFGAEHILFGTDAPFGPSTPGLTLETIRAVERMDIPDTDKEKIFERNAIKLLRVPI